MTYLGALAAVSAAILVAVAISSAAAGRLSVDQRRRHHEVGSPVFNQIGVMFSILLAFVFSDVWGEYKTAAQAINDECGALHGAAMLAGSLPDGGVVVTAARRYAAQVVHREWPDMRQRRRSPEAAAAMGSLLARAAGMRTNTASDEGVKAQVVALISTAHAARETRLFQMVQALPPFLWSMPLTLSTILVLFVAFSGLETPGRLLFVAVFAGSGAVADRVGIRRRGLR